MTQYKLVVDCTTGKQEYAAAEEQAKRDADKAALEAARESGKLKLSSIGLTEEEIKAFGF
jgi:hypothetical protein